MLNRPLFVSQNEARVSELTSRKLVSEFSGIISKEKVIRRRAQYAIVCFLFMINEMNI